MNAGTTQLILTGHVVEAEEALRLGMIDSLKCSALLKGFCGKPLADTDAILSFADMVEALGSRLREAEINPIFVLPKGQGVRAGDGLVVLD
jgi:hypothetical protein